MPRQFVHFSRLAGSGGGDAATMGTVEGSPIPMRKETRFNLIFLALFLAVSLPGAAMLFRSKLDPEARIMYYPPSVRKTLAYMVPHETAGDVVRTQPREVMEFVAETGRSFGGREPLRATGAGGRIRPFLSNGRHYELLDIRPADEGVEVDLLLWHPRANPLDISTAAVDAGDDWEVRNVMGRQQAIPKPVRETMREAGYTKPPQTVALLRVTCRPRDDSDTGLAAVAPGRLRFSSSSDAPALVTDELEIASMLPLVQGRGKPIEDEPRPSSSTRAAP